MANRGITMNDIVLLAGAVSLTASLWIFFAAYRDCSRRADRMARALSEELAEHKGDLFSLHSTVLKHAARIEALELPPVPEHKEVPGADKKVIRRIKKQLKKLS